MSGPPSRCAQLRQRLQSPPGPYLDGGRHLPVNAAAYSGDSQTDQLLGDCAVKAWAVVSMSGRTSHGGRRANADRGDQLGLFAVNYSNRYAV
jgi:hypothetical protein